MTQLKRQIITSVGEDGGKIELFYTANFLSDAKI
jgi:hypothetical protein